MTEGHGPRLWKYRSQLQGACGVVFASDKPREAKGMIAGDRV